MKVQVKNTRPAILQRVRDRLARCLLEGLNHLEHRVAVAATQVVDAATRLLCQSPQRSDVAERQINLQNERVEGAPARTWSHVRIAPSHDRIVAHRTYVFGEEGTGEGVGARRQRQRQRRHGLHGFPLGLLTAAYAFGEASNNNTGSASRATQRQHLLTGHLRRRGGAPFSPTAQCSTAQTKWVIIPLKIIKNNTVRARPRQVDSQRGCSRGRRCHPPCRSRCRRRRARRGGQRRPG